jgi:hypothetical protein
MVRAGLHVEHVEGRVAVSTDLRQATDAFNLERFAMGAAAGAAISHQDAARWIDSLRTVNRAGGFLAAVTMLTVAGRKEL